MMDQEDHHKIQRALASAEITLRVRSDISPMGRRCLENKIQRFRILLADCEQDLLQAKKKGP